MRIISGRWRGLKLQGPDAALAERLRLRPTSDRLRESLFNRIMAGRWPVEVDGAYCLDLFAGTGALGLEALSRGAEHVAFVERSSPAANLLASNITHLGAEAQAETFKRDATKLGKKPEALSASELVFLDPPYGKGLGEKALDSAWRGGWIASGAVILMEEGKTCPTPQGFSLIEVLKQGSSFLHVFQAPLAAKVRLD